MQSMDAYIHSNYKVQAYTAGHPVPDASQILILVPGETDLHSFNIQANVELRNPQKSNF
jgi:hypothetical protein